MADLGATTGAFCTLAGFATFAGFRTTFVATGWGTAWETALGAAAAVCVTRDRFAFNRVGLGRTTAAVLIGFATVL